MSVDLLLFFAVCQAAYVQPDGITLPITSLSYKSLPTNPKEISLSFPTTENIETSNDAKLSEPAKMPSKYFYSGNCNQPPPGPISMLPQSQIVDIKTISPRQVGKPISIQNLNLNTATPQVTALPAINLPRKIENNLLNNYVPTVINDRNDNTVNLKYNVPLIANPVPYMTYKVNNINTPAIYIDCSKQKYFRPEISSLDTRKLEENHLIPERDNTLAQGKNELNKISEAIVAPNLSVNSLQQQHFDNQKLLMAKSVEKQKMLCSELPTSINKDCDSNRYSINNIVFSGGSNFSSSKPSINTLNAPPVSGKITIKPNLASFTNNIDLTVTPSVQIGNSKINSSPRPMTVSGFENIKEISAIKPSVKPLNHIQPPVSTLTSHFYVPRELPKVYQLPNVYTNAEITPVFPSSFLAASPSPISCKESDTYNYVRRENILDTAPVEYSDFSPKNTLIKTTDVTEPINCVPSVSKYYTSPMHISEISTLSQLPNVFTNPYPKVTCPSIPPRTDTNPSNIIYINMANMSPPKSIDNIVPICYLNTEAKLQPIPAVATDTPYYKSLDSNSIKSLNYISVPNNVMYYQPEYINPTIKSLESQYSCPTYSTYPASSDLSGSSISDSLNSIISSLTTGLLSAFYETTSQEENVIPMSPDTEIITNLLTDAPSSIYSETSFSLMPVFLLHPPQLKSPSFLPVPKVDLPLKGSEGKSSTKKKLRKPKPYISTITINLLPSKEAPNDIIVML